MTKPEYLYHYTSLETLALSVMKKPHANQRVVLRVVHGDITADRNTTPANSGIKMVNGFESFRKHFARYENCYTSLQHHSAVI